jgi:hypothetical protein
LLKYFVCIHFNNQLNAELNRLHVLISCYFFQRGRIHATVRKYLVPTIQKMVEEGGTYKLENVMVGFNEGQYKLLPHKHKLSMMNNASFVKVNAPNIPRNVFEFMTFKDILLSHEEGKVVGMLSRTYL